MNIQFPQIVFPENILERIELRLTEVESTVPFGGMQAAQNNQEKKNLKNLSCAARIILESNRANAEGVSIDIYFSKIQQAFDSLANHRCVFSEGHLCEGNLRKKESFCERAASIKVQIDGGEYPIKKISELANRLFMRFKDSLSVSVLYPEEKSLVIFRPAKLQQNQQSRAHSLVIEGDCEKLAVSFFHPLELELGRETPDTARLTQRSFVARGLDPNSFPESVPKNSSGQEISVEPALLEMLRELDGKDFPD